MRAQLSALRAIFLDWCTQDTWIRSLAMSPQSLFFLYKIVFFNDKYAYGRTLDLYFFALFFFLHGTTSSLFGASFPNDRSNAVYVVCRRGNNSQLAVERMRNLLPSAEWPVVIKDIQGGLQAWSTQVDPDFPMYWTSALTFSFHRDQTRSDQLQFEKGIRDFLFFFLSCGGSKPIQANCSRSCYSCLVIYYQWCHI